MVILELMSMQRGTAVNTSQLCTICETKIQFLIEHCLVARLVLQTGNQSVSWWKSRGEGVWWVRAGVAVQACAA